MDNHIKEYTLNKCKLKCFESNERVYLDFTLTPTQETAVEKQVHEIFEIFDGLLNWVGLKPQAITFRSETIYGSVEDYKAIIKTRDKYFKKLAIECWPVSTYVGGYLCQPNVKVQIRLHGLVQKEPSTLKVQIFEPQEDYYYRCLGKLLETRSYKSLYLADRGRGPDFTTQAKDLYTRMLGILEQAGMKIGDILRTWCYIDKIIKNYGAFNEVRNEMFCDYFSEHALPFPGSTGIQAQAVDGAQISMEWYGRKGFPMAFHENPVQQSVFEYGPDVINHANPKFSRVARISDGDFETYYISGTASVGRDGKTLHLGNIKAQIDETLRAQEKLLELGGFSMRHLLLMIAYLKDRKDFPTLMKRLRTFEEKHDIPEINLIVNENDVCRDDFLVELEAIFRRDLKSEVG